LKNNQEEKNKDDSIPKLRVGCCKLEKVIECDSNYIDGYRNKVEFTIGREFIDQSQEGPLCVGFNIGNLAKGIIYAGRPDNIKVIS
jgi:hypothetical protein